MKLFEIKPLLKDMGYNNATSRISSFTIALIYNLLLGFYLKDFLVLSHTLFTFYLLSASPTLFFEVEIKSKAIHTPGFVSLTLTVCMNFAYAVYCRRVFPFWH